MKHDAFHAGELQAQRLAGQIAAGHGIRDYMPDQHRDFFAALPFALLASTGADGAPHAHLLVGPAGFIHSPDPLTLEIACASTLVPGARAGLLGIEFATRRRNRANGVVRSNDGKRLVLTIDESFGNCPKYITQRDFRPRPQTQSIGAFDGLDDAARRIVAAADTFFVATSGGAHGVDISHRGGAPGFARIEGDTLVIPDLSGNRYFNTLGNLLLDARASLLFVDFASGAVLTLTGQTSIAWPGREWRFECAGGTLAITV